MSLDRIYREIQTAESSVILKKEEDISAVNDHTLISSLFPGLQCHACTYVTDVEPPHLRTKYVEEGVQYRRESNSIIVFIKMILKILYVSSSGLSRLTERW